MAIPDRSSLTHPVEWWRETVRPAIADYEADRRASHRARAAVNEVAGFLERVFQYIDHHDRARLGAAATHDGMLERLRSFSRDVVDRYPDIRVIKDAADAGSHHVLHRPIYSGGLPTATTANYLGATEHYIGGSPNRTLTAVIFSATACYSDVLRDTGLLPPGEILQT